MCWEGNKLCCGLKAVRLCGSGVGSNTEQRASGGHGPTSSTCAPTLAFSSPRHTHLLSLLPLLLPPAWPASTASSTLNPHTSRLSGICPSSPSSLPPLTPPARSLLCRLQQAARSPSSTTTSPTEKTSEGSTTAVELRPPPRAEVVIRAHEPHPDCPDTLACLPDTDGRPQHTLPVILRCTILGSPRKRLTIREIYAAMERKYPYYKTAGPAWKVCPL